MWNLWIRGSHSNLGTFSRRVEWTTQIATFPLISSFPVEGLRSPRLLRMMMQGGIPCSPFCSHLIIIIFQISLYFRCRCLVWILVVSCYVRYYLVISFRYIIYFKKNLKSLEFQGLYKFEVSQNFYLLINYYFWQVGSINYYPLQLIHAKR